MKVSERTIKSLAQIITGDNGLSRYRSGSRLVELFNRYGANDVYRKGFPSRWQYAEEKLHNINGSYELTSVICEVLDPREFLDTEFSIEKAYEYINQYLKYDDLEIVNENGFAKIRDKKGGFVACKNPYAGEEKEGYVFIDEQIKKSEQKISIGDYDGAITNARSLVEAVLTELERQLDGTAPPYDGDLIRLYKRVQKLLKLDPARDDVDSTLKQVLSGLSSIITGLSGLSNKMGDRHVRSYKPSKHHALLVVNSSKTLVNFLFETHQFQKKK